MANYYNQLTVKTGSGGTSSTTTPTVTLLDLHESAAGGPNKGYPDQLGKSDMTTFLTGRDMTTEFLPGSYTWSKEYPTLPIKFRDASANGVFPLSGLNFLPIEPDSNSVYLDLIGTRLKSKIYSAQAEFAGGVFLGEMISTLNRARQPAKWIAGYVDNYAAFLRQARARYGKDPTRWPRAFFDQVAQSYLSMVMGILPFAADIESSVTRMNDILSKKRTRRVSASESDEIGEDLKVSPLIQMDRVQYHAFAARKASWTGRGSAMIHILPNGPKVHPGNFGMGTRDFVPTMYELFPYSFVIDYFSNLNQWVQAHYYEQASVVWGWVGIEIMSSSSITYQLDDYVLSPDAASFLAPVGAVNDRRVARVKPSDTVLALGTNIMPNMKQLFNITALLTNLRG